MSRRRLLLSVTDSLNSGLVFHAPFNNSTQYKDVVSGVSLNFETGEMSPIQDNYASLDGENRLYLDDLTLPTGNSPATLAIWVNPESFGVGGIPKSISEDFYEYCRKYPEKTIVMATQVAHEGSDMTVYEVGHEMKARCNFLESYDITLESVIAKTMWMLANEDVSKENQEDIFYKNINYDVIFGKNRKC